MKKIFITIGLALLWSLTVQAQEQRFQVFETGWGNITGGRSLGVPVEQVIGEMNIPRWKKASGSFTMDMEKHTALLKVGRKKESEFNVRTESAERVTRDGWTYTQYEALDGHGAPCLLWLSKREDGDARLLVLYKTRNAPSGGPIGFVYGYHLRPEGN